jgi:hypothetical protein
VSKNIVVNVVEITNGTWCCGVIQGCSCLPCTGVVSSRDLPWHPLQHDIIRNSIFLAKSDYHTQDYIRTEWIAWRLLRGRFAGDEQAGRVCYDRKCVHEVARNQATGLSFSIVVYDNMLRHYLNQTLAVALTGKHVTNAPCVYCYRRFRDV